jgi:two-component system, NtrC family, response regulator AtoC
MTKVLLVDDDEDLARHLASLVRRQGWGTGIAHDGVEAVLQVLDGGWDAVLMDIRMPNLDGLGALKLMRRHNPNLPVILFTGQAGQGDMLRARQLGAYACLVKPLDGEQVVKALTEALALPVQPKP